MNPRAPGWLDVSPWPEAVDRMAPVDVRSALCAESPDIRDFAALLSPAAGRQIETLAQHAEALTRRHFGRTVALYAPLYLSDYCSSGCAYCGFAADRNRARHRLEAEALRRELRGLRQRGIEDVLLLTGERTPQADYAYLHSCVATAAARFSSVAVEAFPMTTAEYRSLACAGCTGVTLYQETYDPKVYAQMHRWGPKRDYEARLDAPSRALAAGMRTVGLGVLLGLADPVLDALCLYQHATYLRRMYWRGGITLSFPRVRPQAGGFSPPVLVTDRQLVQWILAFRLCLPNVPLVLSTREAPHLRDGLAGLGICKMSVDSHTTVGGYGAGDPARNGQFEVTDARDVPTFCAMLRSKRLEPVFKNGDAVYRQRGGG